MKQNFRAKQTRDAQIQAHLSGSGHSLLNLGIHGSGSRPNLLEPSESSIYQDTVSTVSQLRRIEPISDASQTPSPQRAPSPPRTDSTATVRTVLGHEAWYKIARDIAFPVAIVGISLAYCGYLFDKYREEAGNSFHEIPELSVLVAPLFRLKSNLELVAVSKLTVRLNLGQLKTLNEKVNYAAGDMCLAQVQSITAGFVAALIAVVIVISLEPSKAAISSSNTFTIISSAGLTSAMTTLVFGIMTVIMLFILFRFNINPDNIGVPLTIALGEITTLYVLYFVSNYIYNHQHTKWLAPTLAAVLFWCVPWWGLLSYKYENSKKQLYDWVLPVLCSIVLSCGAGLILDAEGSKFPTIALYQELITGVSGALISVHYSRIITSYYRTGKLGVIPAIKTVKGKIWYTPIDVAWRLGIHTRGFWVFVIVVFPAQTLFSVLLFQISPSHSKNCYGTFLWMYVLSCGLHVIVLLYTTHTLTNIFWKHKVDPSAYVIPLIHGFGDVLGTAFLLVVCYCLVEIQHCDLEVSSHNHKHKRIHY